MHVYQSVDGKEGALDNFVRMLRRMGYAAYSERDGRDLLLITDYVISGSGFVYIGVR